MENDVSGGLLFARRSGAGFAPGIWREDVHFPSCLPREHPVDLSAAPFDTRMIDDQDSNPFRSTSHQSILSCHRPQLRARPARAASHPGLRVLQAAEQRGGQRSERDEEIAERLEGVPRRREACSVSQSNPETIFLCSAWCPPTARAL